MKLTDAQKETMFKLQNLTAGTEIVISALAERLKKKPAAVGKILKSLHKKGLIAYNPEKDCYVTRINTED